MTHVKPQPRLAFFGSPDFAVPILEALATQFDIRLVVTQPDKPVGKGLKLQSSAVAQAAERLGLPTLKPNRLNDPEIRLATDQTPVDLAVVVAYGKILPQWLLDWPQHGAVNVHASLLPKYRGASPIAAAILAGDSTTGVTFMLMNERMDEGHILAQVELSIEADDTMLSLSTKLSQLSARHAPEVIHDYLAGMIAPQPQDHTQASYTTLLRKDDGQIDFQRPPDNLEAMIRAYHPWPGVWGRFEQKRVKLLPEDFVQMEGKKPVKRSDFLRGYPGFGINF